MSDNIDKLNEINAVLARTRDEAADRRSEAERLRADADAWARQEMRFLPYAYHALVEFGERAGTWLVDDWRRAWTWISVQAMVLAAAIEGAWDAFPQTMQGILPENEAHWVARVVLLLGIIGRLKRQGGGAK